MTKINFDKGTSVIVVDVYVEHKGRQKKVRMALDTGATYMMIPWEVAESLGLEAEVSKERIDMITASGIEKVPLEKLDNVSVGTCEAKNVKAIIHDLPPKSYVDGLLGLSFLRNFHLHINFTEGIFELARNK